jgi:hypothetical protein
MFHRASKPLGRLLSLLDDVLADPFDEASPHPHRRPLRWQRERRPGSIEKPSMQCTSPVRAGVRSSSRGVATR